jgi:hypothetical protein
MAARTGWGAGHYEGGSTRGEGCAEPVATGRDRPGASVAGGGAHHVALHIASCAVVRLGAAARGLRRVRGRAGGTGAPPRARDPPRARAAG